MKNVEDYCPANYHDWRKWLELNHNKKDGVWLIFYKKKSPKFNLSWSDSVDQALCFGWIDSVKKTIDTETYKQYFSKRKPKSNWSKINKDKVQFLIEQGLMNENGYKSIEIAKANGSWTFLDQIEALIIPEDLKEEFAKHNNSLAFFKCLSNSNKKILLYWVVSAKRKETRKKRVFEIAYNASKNLKPRQFRY
ncbi:YdeI/OmpD-associated family protein [Lutibacter sp. A64]|uniref:YdeI/OmpD-associated family protein n=1 Tax=Lutibacter sp. A64 TaxID=2918526 RepID=UPI001F054A64|nr:YdeI/OmpD-associated family protein [Lutibacter sp. A64]UMB53530.1 YdeI/OmpD-associated family protein [Lutibacter sp. A64]